MHKKMGQIFKKILLLFLACIMVIIILPPVIFYNVADTTDYGEFLRISPSVEDYSKTRGEFADISKGENASYEFDFSHFKKTNAQDIVSAKIRLAFLSGSGSVDNRISVKVGNFQKFAVINPDTKSDEHALWEIDVTDYIKELIKVSVYNLKIELSCENNIGPLVGTGKSFDPSMRPYLKIATGQWVDIDAPTLKRAEVLNTVYVSKNDPDITAGTLTRDRVYAGKGNVTYISVKLNQAAFLGEASSAILSLEKQSSADADVEVHCLNNDEWTPESLSGGALPGGPEMTVKNMTLKGTGRVNIDVTQAINEARKKGIDALTFYIVAKGSSFATFSSGADMYIEETDDKNLICALEGGVYALSNNNPEKVTTNLRKMYTAENGEKADILWSQYEDEGVLRVTREGEIIRPLWYEPDAEVFVKAEISSGNHKIMREFNITIAKEEKPSYKGYEFGNYINIGKSASEKDAKFESIRTSGTKRRWTGGGYSDYRTLSENGVMLLNLSCDSEGDNYITFKLWKKDEPCVMSLADCLSGDEMLIKTPPAEEDDGFIYATYKLPIGFTSGKDSVSLRLSSKEESCGIYGVYITDSAYFNPAEFKAHGEKIVENSLSGSTAQSIKIDKENNRVTLVSRDGKAVFELGEDTATVSQTLKSYSRYSSSCPQIAENGVEAVDYGEYKLIWNETETERPIPYGKLEMSGVYKDVETGAYYTFFEDWQTDDVQIIPQNAKIYNGREHRIKAGETMVLVHIANPMRESAWMVSMVNGVALSEIRFDKERLSDIQVMLMGSLPDEVNTAQAILGIYENDKLVSMHKRNFKILKGESVYDIDFSKDEIYVNENQSLRIFVIDKTQKLTEVQPLIEIS